MTGGQPLDERYFKWLYKKIGSVSQKNPARSYWLLAEIMYKTQFDYFVPNDDNRAEDGKALRSEFFAASNGLFREDEWESLDCSVLEMLIALSRRAAFEVYEVIPNNTTGDWFHRLIANLDLIRFNDEAFLINEGYCNREVTKVLTRLNNRSYRPNGTYGLFPLKNPHGDQRRVEIWYQMSQYLLELS